MTKLIRGLTESGDYYSGTRDAWDRYRKFWEIGAYQAVEDMECGRDPDFFYDPEEGGDD